MNTFSVLEFHQYASGTDDDKVLRFAVPAKALAAWAGIPRKGWHIRLLYQRWITAGREKEVKEFWNTASKLDATPPAGQKAYILGPTALTIAVHGTPDIRDGKIALEYIPPYDLSKPPAETLQTLAGIVLERVKKRLADSQKLIFDQFAADPLKELPDAEHDYVLESLMQFAQMQKDPGWFISKYALAANDVYEIIQALESLCRPALVVDGQHRLHEASECDSEVLLPVVAIPNCTWAEQIYRFVVVNEKGQAGRNLAPHRHFREFVDTARATLLPGQIGARQV